MRKSLLVLLLAMALPCWADKTVKIGDIVWHTDYRQALALARQQGLPLWVHFGENPG